MKKKSIVSVKGQNVIIDSDVAKIYGMETREVNQAIKNNPDKFPIGYIVEADKDELIKNFDKFKNIKNYPGTPKAFTEKGLYMLATILKSPQAAAAMIWHFGTNILIKVLNGWHEKVQQYVDFILIYSTHPLLELDQTVLAREE